MITQATRDRILRELKKDAHSGLLTPERVFTMLELCVLRFRDEATGMGWDAHDAMDTLADLFREIRKSWQPWEHQI